MIGFLKFGCLLVYNASDFIGVDPVKYFKDPRLQTFYEYWQSLRNGDGFPCRAQIDYDALATLITGMWQCDYEPELGTFRYNFAGEELESAVGMDLHGRLLSDFITGEQYQIINASLYRTITEPCIFYMAGAVYHRIGRYAQGERLGLPLQEPESEQPDGLLGLTVADTMPVRAEKAGYENASQVFFPIPPCMAA